MPNFTFCGGHEHRTSIFFFWLEQYKQRVQTIRINSRKIFQHLTNWTRRNKRDKVWNSVNSRFKWRFPSWHRRCCLSSLPINIRLRSKPCHGWFKVMLHNLFPRVHAGRFVTTVFGATQQCNVGTMLQPLRNNVVRTLQRCVALKSLRYESSHVRSPLGVTGLRNWHIYFCL